MDVSYMTCPNCKVELVIEQKIIGLHGLEEDVADAVLDAYDQALAEHQKQLSAIREVSSESQSHIVVDHLQEAISG